MDLTLAGFEDRERRESVDEGMRRMKKSITSILFALFAAVTICCEKPNGPHKGFWISEYVRDYEYVRNTFFDIGILGTPEQLQNGEADFSPGYDTILDFRLFVEEVDINKYIVTPGTAYADPATPDSFRVENYTTTWMELSSDRYYVQPGLFYVEMKQYISETENLACWMQVQRGDEVLEVGDVSNTFWTLMLLKRDCPLPSYRTFKYVWKNVYSVYVREIPPDHLDIMVFKGKSGDEGLPNNPDSQNGVRYIEILGLDRYDSEGKQIPDGKVDLTDELFDFDRGYLLFPDRKPFASDSLEEPVPEIYYWTNIADLKESSKYYLRVRRYVYPI